MKRAELGQVVRFRGELYEVLTIAEGRDVGLRPVRLAPCSSCGNERWVHILEGSPMFEDEVEPVATVTP